MQDSIKSLKGELYRNENGNFVTRLSLAFMTGASFDFKAYRKASLPSTKQSVDVWLLRGQEVLLTKGSKTEDEVIDMMFSGFTSTMRTAFAQDVTPIK